MTRTTDRGRTAERLGSIDPAEMHCELLRSAVGALRKGAPAVMVDGLEFWRMSDFGARVVDAHSRRLDALRAELADAEVAYVNARENSNEAKSQRTREDFLADAERESERIEDLKQELSLAEAEHGGLVTPAHFDSDCDFLAHALAALVTYGEHAPKRVIEAVSQIIEFTRFEPILAPDPPLIEVDYYLLLPAEGRVARYGPITFTVVNRAYRNTLRDNGDSQRARALLSQRLGHDPGAPSHRALQAVTDHLVTSLGWTRLAARTLATSGCASLYAVAARLLWNDPLPDDLDPAYVDLVRAIYSDAGFAWDPRRHALDCQLRQLTVDATLGAGGKIGMVELEARLGDTRVDDVRITIFSRDQQLGRAPVWKPCLHRRGDWIQQHPKSGRSLTAVRCPHCDRFASKVIRTPETPECLLCPGCLRMPSSDSPRFPAAYLNLC